jgi:hypothetical protein
VAKQAGLGDNFYIAGNDLSGDISALDRIGGGPAAMDLTPINVSAHVRVGGQRDADWAFTSWFDNAAGHGVQTLETLPTTDVVASYFRGTTIGNAAAGISAKQVDYVPNRANNGDLTLKVSLKANGFGMNWGKMLTAGLRTDSSATTGAFFDDTAGTNFGGCAYVQLNAFSGTSVTIDIQSATTSGGSYSTTGLTTAALTAKTAVRLAVANTVTINEFLKVVTTGTFSNAVFSVIFVRYPVAGVVY